jgi:multidrug efflux pump
MNALIDAAISHSRTVLATLMLILIAGAVAYWQIPKEADPDINIPIIYVSIAHKGISPEDAERLLVRPLEQELRTVEGVEEMRSTAYQGGANVILEFDAGFDADKALADVRDKVDDARPELPEDSDEPTVNEVNVGLFPAILITLSGEVPERTLRRLGRDLEDKLEAITSVFEAKIAGDRDEQVEIIIDPLLAESYRLSGAEVIESVRRSNLLVAAGSVDTGRGRFAVKVPGLFDTIDDLLDMPVRVSGDAVVTVRDIAAVRRSFKDPESFSRLNGRPAITLEVSKRSGENIIATIQQVRAIGDLFPGQVDLHPGYVDGSPEQRDQRCAAGHDRRGGGPRSQLGCARWYRRARLVPRRHSGSGLRGTDDQHRCSIQLNPGGRYAGRRCDCRD